MTVIIVKVFPQGTSWCMVLPMPWAKEALGLPSPTVRVDGKQIRREDLPSEVMVRIEYNGELVICPVEGRDSTEESNRHRDSEDDSDVKSDG